MKVLIGTLLLACMAFVASPTGAGADWREGVYGQSWKDTSGSGATEAAAPRRATRSTSSRRAAAVAASEDTPKAKAPSRQASAAKSSGAAKSSVAAKSSGASKSVASKSSESSGTSYQSGIASYYWQPQRVASGGWFDPNAMTAAHKTLPFGTRVRVTNKNNGQSVVVTINDRGPYIAGRVIDLSSAAAGVVGMKGSGIVPVNVSILSR